VRVITKRLVRRLAAAAECELGLSGVVHPGDTYRVPLKRLTLGRFSRPSARKDGTTADEVWSFSGDPDAWIVHAKASFELPIDGTGLIQLQSTRARPLTGFRRIIRDMEIEALVCPDCSATYALSDNYCRQCGMYLAAVRGTTTLTTRTEHALEPVRPGLPAPVRRAATAVAVGAALQVGLGLASRYIAAQAGQKAARAAITSAQPRGRRAVARRDEPAGGSMDGVTAVSETVLIRRVWVRSGKRD
jgi:hypothetical protein